MTKQTAEIDLSACEREAIRVPGSIQPHGFVLMLDDATHAIIQLSENAAGYTGKAVDALLGAPLAAAVGDSYALTLRAALSTERLERPTYLGTVQLANEARLDVLGHRSQGLVILEFEAVKRSAAAADFRLLYPLVGTFLSRLSDATSVEAMSHLAALEIKHITGFGRVLVYHFDHQDHGHVVAEIGDPGYPSYLNQRFPAADVPVQARELYVTNHIRLIPDANYQPARLIPEHNPLTGAPTDLTFSTLRSVSPVHLQYMRNMGTPASMSISLVVKGRLWGLISCHHAEPRYVPFEVRAACEHLAQILALRIESREESDESQYRLELRRILVAMLAGLSRTPDFTDNVASVSHDLLRFGSASGVALVFEHRICRFGDAPSEEDIRELVQWLSTYSHDDVFHTDALSQLMPEARRMARQASGILAIPISRLHRHYLIWFRPEVVHTIEWAGDPHEKERQAQTPGAALTPRASFDTWRETVHGTSLPWRASEIETALEFRTALLGIVLERAEQMAELAEELGRANKELESFSYSVSHDLRAPLRHIVGYSDLLLEFERASLSERGERYLRNIKDSARFAGKLVDDLLSFSQMGRASLRPRQTNLNELVNACIERLSHDLQGREVRWEIGELPTLVADPSFLQLALHNLLANAVKYTRPRQQAVISVSGETTADSTIVHVRDNGVGFNAEYKHKLFGVFQRLHRLEEFEGTGIGLANVQRIVERHGGQVWADSVLGEGASFSFSIPKQLPLD
ncbi:MAG TPA: ATP-binding protein [Noviherbaspirillum sp.]